MSKKSVSYVFNVDANYDKATPQVKQILKGVADSKKHTFTLAEMKEFIAKLSNDGFLVTTQVPWRIFQYYRQSMIDNDFMSQRNDESIEDVLPANASKAKVAKHAVNKLFDSKKTVVKRKNKPAPAIHI
tara:strand:- start:633 stop:1019 length:387 start_codon:yes stop_codon:yes gene_type:complete